MNKYQILKFFNKNTKIVEIYMNYYKNNHNIVFIYLFTNILITLLKLRI